MWLFYHYNKTSNFFISISLLTLLTGALIQEHSQRSASSSAVIVTQGGNVGGSDDGATREDWRIHGMFKVEF